MFFFFLIDLFFAHKKLKKHPQKLRRKTQIHFFILTAQTEEFMFQNVAYRPTVRICIELGFRSFRGPLFCKPVTGLEIFYSKPALVLIDFCPV